MKQECVFIITQASAAAVAKEKDTCLMLLEEEKARNSAKLQEVSEDTQEKENRLQENLRGCVLAFTCATHWSLILISHICDVIHTQVLSSHMQQTTTLQAQLDGVHLRLHESQSTSSHTQGQLQQKVRGCSLLTSTSLLLAFSCNQGQPSPA